MNTLKNIFKKKMFFFQNICTAKKKSQYCRLKMKHSIIVYVMDSLKSKKGKKVLEKNKPYTIPFF